MGADMSVTIERVQSAEQFRELLEVLLEYERSLDVDLRHGAEPTLSAITERYQAPSGALLAYVDGAVAGCVAMHALDTETTVMQRLYARPSFRKHGVGRSLVEAIVACARDGAFRRIVLDTDRERLQAAYRLYIALGFTPCEPFAPVDYANSTYLEKMLD